MEKTEHSTYNEEDMTTQHTVKKTVHTSYNGKDRTLNIQ